VKTLNIILCISFAMYDAICSDRSVYLTSCIIIMSFLVKSWSEANIISNNSVRLAAHLSIIWRSNEDRIYIQIWNNRTFTQ